MDVLITDANIWIDLDVGGLTGPFFELPSDIAVPEALYHEELAAQHSYLLGFGLELQTVSGPNVSRLVDWQSDYPDASRYDLLALSLADQIDGTLLTGDSALRNAAEREDLEVHGTIWIGDRLLEHDLVDKQELRSAYKTMRDGDRRLPWDRIDERLNELGLPPLS